MSPPGRARNARHRWAIWLALPAVVGVLAIATIASGGPVAHLDEVAATARPVRDSDRDGLRDDAEARHHTDPRKPDTDKDGLKDGAEVNRYRTNPRDRDTDGDGLTDGDEVNTHKTNPRKRDTDGDSYTDRIELRGGTNPRNARSHLGFPDKTTTGVPTGTVLTPHSGDLVVTANNAVVDAMDVSGCIDVRATGVTIRSSRARCVTTDYDAAASDPANPPLTVQDSNVDCGPGVGGTGVFFRNIRLVKVEITGCENGVAIDTDVDVQDSYIHNLDQCVTVGCIEPDAHTDGIQASNGSNSTIQHNTIYGFTPPCTPGNGGRCNGTSAININNNPNGPTSTNVTISDNLLAGGAVALYCPKPATSNFTITNNQFSTVYSTKVGEFGASTDCAGETQSGNVYHQTGLPLGLG